MSWLQIGMSSLLILGIGFLLGIWVNRLTNGRKSYPKILSNEPKNLSLSITQETSSEKTMQDAIRGAIEQERTRIKYALHDDTVQRLIATKLKLEFYLLTPKDSYGKEYGNIILDELDRTITGLRFLLANMDEESIVDRTLSELVHEFETKFKGFYFMRVMVREQNIENTFVLTAKEKSEILFILSESLQNAIKHSVSDQFHIHITWQLDALVVEAEDRGFGMNNSEKRGYGISSMQARADAIGASFSVESFWGKGVEVKIILPKTKPNHFDAES